MKPVRVLIVDDHPMIRYGITSLLKNNDEIIVIGEAENGKEGIEKTIELNADLVIMDIKMPVMNGIEACHLIKEKRPSVKILAFSMYDEHQYIADILQAGASGYILKNTGKQELITAIKKIMDGNTYFSDEVVNVLISPYQSPEEKLEKVNLTKREIEVLKLIAAEFTNQQIGKKLFISPRTVDTHRLNLLKKLKVKNTAGLVKCAMQMGLIED